MQRTLLSFFDTAGEDLITADSLARNARYLASADGIILLLDPLQMKARGHSSHRGCHFPSRSAVAVTRSAC